MQLPKFTFLILFFLVWACFQSLILKIGEKMQLPKFTFLILFFLVWACTTQFDC